MPNQAHLRLRLTPSDACVLKTFIILFEILRWGEGVRIENMGIGLVTKKYSSHKDDWF